MFEIDAVGMGFPVTRGGQCWDVHAVFAVHVVEMGNFIYM